MLSRFRKISIAVVAIPLLLASPSILLTPAYAAGTGDLGGGTGGGGSNGGGGTGGGNNSGGGGGTGNGGGGSTPTPDPWAFSSRETRSDIVSDNCSVRDDGKKALAVDFHYSKKFKVTTGAKPSVNWYFFQNSSGGNITWARDYLVKKVCLFPSRTYTKTINCPITYSVELNKALESFRNLVTRDVATRYKASSKDYNSCLAAQKRTAVSAQTTVSEYGYYNVFTWNKSQNVTVEVPYTKNGLTNIIDSPKIIASSPVTTSPKKQGMTGSLDCKNGWKTPGSKSSKFWFEDNCGGDSSNGKGSFECKAAPIKFNGKTHKNNTLEIMSDGKPNKVQFNTKVVGSGITVKSYKTHFEATGMPWLAGQNLNKNAVELRKSQFGTSFWTSHSASKSKFATAATAKKLDTVYFSAYQASNPGKAGSKLSQVIEWTGTRKVQSVEFIGIDGKTGQATTRVKTVNVPTSGTCTTSMNLNFVRAIGDVQ